MVTDDIHGGVSVKLDFTTSHGSCILFGASHTFDIRVFPNEGMKTLSYTKIRNISNVGRWHGGVEGYAGPEARRSWSAQGRFLEIP